LPSFFALFPSSFCNNSLFSRIAIVVVSKIKDRILFLSSFPLACFERIKVQMQKEKLSDYRLLGESGLRVSPLCLGTMTFGDIWPIRSTKEEGMSVLDQYVKLGGNFIDTANVYQAGQSEQWIGEFMEEYGNREDLVIGSKYTSVMTSKAKVIPSFERPYQTSPPFNLPGTLFAPCNHIGNQRKNLFQAVEASLERLKTTYLDILWVHYWDYTMKPEVLMRALDDVVSSGKVLHVAISDAPVWAVAECNAIAEFHGWTPFTAMQYRYGLLDRTIERGPLPYSTARNVPMVNWECLGGGRLTGKYRRGLDMKDAADSARSTSGWLSMTDRDYDIVEVVEAVAKEQECSPAQVAIQWTRHQTGVLSPLVGCRTLQQAKNNFDALQVALTEEQLRRLSEVSAIDLGYIHTFSGSSYKDCPSLIPGGNIV
jgi:aryl-alcohol dehydrogenase-like predicted oxidoreductase